MALFRGGETHPTFTVDILTFLSFRFRSSQLLAAGDISTTPSPRTNSISERFLIVCVERQ
jgi:hypothetical protein